MIKKLDWTDFDLDLECEATEESFEEMRGISFEWKPEFSECDDCYEVCKIKCNNGDILYSLSNSAGYMVGLRRGSSDRFVNFFYNGASIYSENEEWNELYNEACSYVEYFNETLKAYQVGGGYLLDVDAVTGGRLAWERERRTLEAYLDKIREYESLGGFTCDILNYEDIDDYLGEIKNKPLGKDWY